MSSSSARIPSKPTRPSFTGRQMPTSTTPDACTRSAKAPTTSRSTRSSFAQKTGSTLLPYMATQADSGAWEEECAFPNAPEAKARQGFFPDGSRSFEEIDRLQIGEKGTGNLISANAEIDFYRILPPSGYTKGLPADRRTDTGAGEIAAERRGVDFFPYKPPHLAASAPRPALARITNATQEILASG